MEKLNIVELLKDCPTGMELDCTLFEGLEFDCIVDNEYLPIRCRIKHPNGGYTVYNFTKYGCWLDTTFAKCVIYPKGKTNWEGFQRPFKDGDVVVCEENKKITQMFILKSQTAEKKGYCHIGYDFRHNELFEADEWYFDRLAPEEEKQKLFDAIKDNGYKWNPETKTLEKLIIPKFKAGDKIEKCSYSFTITEVKEDYYLTKCGDKIPIENQDDFNLISDKFNINTLKPFESRVLVRDYNTHIWEPVFWGKLLDEKNPNLRYLTTNGCFKYCIPYENNQHLLGTTNDCDEYYKTWE